MIVLLALLLLVVLVYLKLRVDSQEKRIAQRDLRILDLKLKIEQISNGKKKEAQKGQAEKTG